MILAHDIIYQTLLALC